MYRWFSIAVVLVALLLTAYLVFRGGASGAREVRCRVEERLGHTIVRLSGPPRDKGRALGSALAARIREELRRALPSDQGTRDFVVTTAGERLAPFLPRDYRDEIEGIAEGASISFDEALFLNTRFELIAHRLVPGEGDLPTEGAVGPGPSAGCLFLAGEEQCLVLVVHEDRDPPLWLVARPGMAGGFLGLRGNVAAAMRPMRSETPPGLHGLVWTLLLRRLLEAPGATPPATGGVSVAMALPDGSAGTRNVFASAATWYAADAASSLTTDEVAGAGPQRRDPADRARILEAASRLLDGPPPPGRGYLGLLSSGDMRLIVDGPGGRRETPLSSD